MEQTDARRPPGTRLRGFSSAIILVAGVLLIPMAISLVFNSWTSPDAHDYVRMAFAQVAASVVAMTTAVGLVVHRIASRSPLSDTLWFGLIAVLIIAWQATALAQASDTLLLRLFPVAF